MKLAPTEKIAYKITASIYNYITDEKPVPVLLALDSQMLGIFYVDDNSFEKNLARGHIISLTYIAQEDTFYWINDSKNIVRMNGLNNTGEVRIQ